MSESDVHWTDGRLIAAVLAGERDRFAVIVGRYQSALLRAALSRLGRPEWAEDAVQETFLCAYKFLASYDSAFSFRTWLWTILLNQCRRHYQRLNRSARHTQDGRNDLPADEMASHEPGPAERTLAKEQSERLDSILSRLPQSQADALRLRFFGGLKYQEIASVMTCSLSSAKNRVRWGLEKMAKMLVDQGGCAR